MKRQTIFGILFFLIGLVVLAAGLYPALAKLPPSVTLTLAGLGTALFGAWLIPSSSVGVTVINIVATLGKTNIPWIGGRRSDDPPLPPGGAP